MSGDRRGGWLPDCRNALGGASTFTYANRWFSSRFVGKKHLKSASKWHQNHVKSADFGQDLVKWLKMQISRYQYTVELPDPRLRPSLGTCPGDGGHADEHRLSVDDRATPVLREDQASRYQGQLDDF